MLESTTTLMRAARRLIDRIDELEQKLNAGDEAAWPAYIATTTALAAIAPSIRPEARGALLTTEQMAQRLGVTPKTLLRRKAAGDIRPTLQRGRLIRWSGSETAAR